MGDRNGRASMLDPRRNQTVERKKLFEEMLLKEMPGRMELFCRIGICRIKHIQLKETWAKTEPKPVIRLNGRTL